MLTDAVYGGTLAAAAMRSDLELTTAWNVNAAYEHFWNPRWRTSLYGGYAAVSYSDRGNAIPLCIERRAGSGAGTAAVANAGCDNDWQTWWLGSRTQWNVTKDFYMGVDVMYSKLSAPASGNTTTCTSVAIGGATTTSPTWTTGSSASACIATSIPDRVAAV